MSDTEDAKLLEEIRDYWGAASRLDVDADGLRPTARDPWLQEAVETAMERWLDRGARLLDIGCGDGRSTLRFSRRVSSALGIDFIEAYVDKAIAEANAARVSNVAFEPGNALDLADLQRRHGPFDVVTTIRCLINLGTAANQFGAIGEIARCLRPGGLYLASEGWTEGLAGLNVRRQRANLAPIETVKYNLLLSRLDFERAVAPYFELLAYVSLGFYLFMSRVFQPRLVAPAAPKHDHPINAIAAALQAGFLTTDDFLDCDYAGVYVLRRMA
jgi:ubiquinone/menaquinone biosynthesis C-methylase UbiE